MRWPTGLAASSAVFAGSRIGQMQSELLAVALMCHLARSWRDERSAATSATTAASGGDPISRPVFVRKCANCAARAATTDAAKGAVGWPPAQRVPEFSRNWRLTVGHREHERLLLVGRAVEQEEPQPAKVECALTSEQIDPARTAGRALPQLKARGGRRSCCFETRRGCRHAQGERCGRGPVGRPHADVEGVRRQEGALLLDLEVLGKELGSAHARLRERAAQARCDGGRRGDEEHRGLTVGARRLALLALLGRLAAGAQRGQSCLHSVRQVRGGRALRVHVLGK
eukprot:3150924-Prymnesium_polylepis.1